ncbi:MAG TPA: F0F1 ATP synthase subunit B [Gemmatimonadales bacterium]|nr:F0F1 ATP synthase subunit B [Gemmatimonadales bacterium]
MMLPLLLRADQVAGELPAPFSPTWGLFIWTWFVFLPLLFLLKKFVYPLIFKATVEREQRITAQLAEAAQARDDAQAALEEQRHLLAGARGEAQAILADARQAAERERQAGVEKTRAEQEELLARARREIAAEKDRVTAEIRREAVDIAIAAAGKVISTRYDADADRKLVEEYLAGIGKQA